MSRIVVTDLKSPSPPKNNNNNNRHRARVDDRVTGPRQTSLIDQNHSGLSLLIKQHGDLWSEKAGDRAETARGSSGSRSKKNILRIH